MSKNEHRKNHQQKGFSLVTVMLIGACAALWLTAMTAALIPMYKRAQNNSKIEDLRTAAESSIDFVIDQISTSLASNTASPYDDTVPGAPWTTRAMLATVYNVPGVTVNVTVKNVTPPKPPTTTSVRSTVYDQVSENGLMANYWRVVEATATLNGTSRSYRVILKPQLWPHDPNSAWRSTTSSSSLNPMNKYGAFGYSGMTLGQNTSTDGYQNENPSQQTQVRNFFRGKTGYSGGDIASYGTVSMQGSSSRPVVIGGSLQVPQNAGPLVTAASSNSSNSNRNQVNQLVTVNGQVANISDGSLGGSGNVLGMTTSGFPSANPLQSGQNTTQIPVVPAPPPTPFFKDISSATDSSPTVVQNLGDLNLTNLTLTISNSASAPPPGGYVIPAGATSFSIQPGNYTVGSITTGTSGGINVSSNVSASQPVRFFISDNTTSQDAISLPTGSQGIRNSSTAPNLQIYYNGSRPISMTQSSSFTGTVYAPNASITLGSRNSGMQNFYGSFVGDSVQTTYAAIHYDQTGLQNGGGSSGYSAQLDGTYNRQVLSSVQPKTPFWYFTIASWQEWSPLKALPTNQ